MKFYLLKETLEACTEAELADAGKTVFVALLTTEEWKRDRARFDMGIELDPTAREIHSTKAEVNYDSLTGTFRIPDRDAPSDRDFRFAYALDERGVVFIDDSGVVERMLEAIAQTRRWREPCLERFLYDFLEQIISRDLSVAEKYESELDRIEDAVLAGEGDEDLGRVTVILSDVRELHVHYEQLIDMAQELVENENGFFDEDRLRYLHLFLSRMTRLQETESSLREHSLQVRDLYRAQLEIRQNRIMTLLTVVTTIFMPLTLIVGWYGMNFRYMPELEYRWAYPVLFVVSVVIVVVSLVFFKKKKWM